MTLHTVPSTALRQRQEPIPVEKFTAAAPGEAISPPLTPYSTGENTMENSPFSTFTVNTPEVAAAVEANVKHLQERLNNEINATINELARISAKFDAVRDCGNNRERATRLPALLSQLNGTLNTSVLPPALKVVAVNLQNSILNEIQGLLFHLVYADGK